MGEGLKIVFVDNRLALDHALRLAKEGHDVYYFHEWRYRYGRVEDMIGIGLHDRLIVIPEIWDYVDDADLVVIADVGYGGLGGYLRGLGLSVFGGNEFGDSLENSRLYAASVMDSIGVNHPNYYEAVGVEKLMDLAERLDYDFFLKVDMLRGNMETARITSREKLLAVLNDAKFGPFQSKIRFICSEPVEGIELGVDAWFNGQSFVRPYHFGNECFDGETEILTEMGWVRFDELERHINDGIRVLSMDLGSGLCEYVPIRRFIKYWYDGPMIYHKNGSFNFLVTPNHKFYVRNQFDYYSYSGGLRKSFRGWREMSISEIIKQKRYFYVPRRVRLQREDIKYVEIAGNNYDADNFFRLVAWVLAEGHLVWNVDKGTYCIFIVQSNKKPENVNRISFILKDLGIKYSAYDWNGDKTIFYLSGKELIGWFKDNCFVSEPYISNNKKLPEIIRRASPRQMRLFLEEYVLGDGHREGNGRMKIFSVSKNLIDGIHEILILSGNFGVIHERKVTHWVGKNEIIYILDISTREEDLGDRIYPSKSSIINYSGFVYDVEVEPWHTIYVRRKGHPFWSSNCKGTGCCFGKWVEESVWDDVLDRFETVLRGRYWGTISFEAIYDGEELYVLDVTSRFAKPAGALQYFSVDNYGSVLRSVAAGEDLEIKPKATYTAQVSIDFSETEKWWCLGQLPDNVVVSEYAQGIDGDVWIYNRDETHNLVHYLGAGDDLDRLLMDVDIGAFKMANRLGLTYSSYGVKRFIELREDFRKYGIDF